MLKEACLCMPGKETIKCWIVFLSFDSRHSCFNLTPPPPPSRQAFHRHPAECNKMQQNKIHQLEQWFFCSLLRAQQVATTFSICCILLH